MKQDDTEANDNFLERFKAAVGTVELANGSNMLYSYDIIDKAGTTATGKEINTETDHYQAMLFLKKTRRETIR